MARCCLGDGVLRFIVIHSCILYALKFTDRSLLSHNNNILIVIIFSTPFRYYVRLKIIRERNYILVKYTYKYTVSTFIRHNIIYCVLLLAMVRSGYTEQYNDIGALGDVSEQKVLGRGGEVGDE